MIIFISHSASQSGKQTSADSRPCSQTKRTRLLPRLPILRMHCRLITYTQFLLLSFPPLPKSALWHREHAQPSLTFSSPRAVVQPGWANKRLGTAKYGPTLAPARNFQPLWSQTHLHSSIWSKTLIPWKICSLSKSCALTHAFKVSFCLAALGTTGKRSPPGCVQEGSHQLAKKIQLSCSDICWGKALQYLLSISIS